jgi:hypothetical protein
MGWVVRAGLAAGIYLALAGSGFAQTNEACVLRCIDRGNLDQTCEARCSKGVPPANPPAANRTSEPAQQSAPSLPAAQSAPPPAVQATPPPAVQATPPVTSGSSGSQPAAPRSAPAPAPAQAAPSSPAAQSAPTVAPAQSAPQPTAAQSAPQQSVKPPEPPVNQRCVLLGLDHGHLDQYCDRVCALSKPGASPAAPASK